MKTQFLFLLLFLPLIGFAQQSATDTTGNFSTDYRSTTGAAQYPQAEIDIPPTTDALQATLYELTDEYYAVHQLHWNLTGPLFISLHELYEEMYTGLSEQIDAVAERKLALNQAADDRPAAVAQNSDLAPATPEGFVTDKRSLEIVAARHKQLSDNLAERITATGETDLVTQDLLISVKYMVDHQLYKIRSFMK